MNSRGSKSVLFLMEQLIVLLVFAVCAAICVRIFFTAYIIANESSERNNAILVAESGAECFKASSGDLGFVADILGGEATDDALSIYYDEDWSPCDREGADYIMRLSLSDKTESLVSCDLIVEKTAGDEIFALALAARRSQ